MGTRAPALNFRSAERKAVKSEGSVPVSVRGHRAPTQQIQEHIDATFTHA